MQNVILPSYHDERVGYHQPPPEILHGILFSRGFFGLASVYPWVSHFANSGGRIAQKRSSLIKLHTKNVGA